MNRDDERNSFKSYTVVYALYCSGDVWGGDSTRPYTNYKGESVVQKGLANAQATLDWVVQQQASGALAETFSELVVMGCSAGSIGTQLWGKQILDTLKWKQAAIVPDSYVGVFPEGVIGQLIYNFGFCSSGFLSPELYAKCMAQQLTLTDINLEFIAQNPSVPYGFVQSKVDIVQQAFYIAVAFTTNTTDQLISPTEFYESVTDIFSTYNNKLSNFVTYLVDGLQHCFTNRYYFFTADGYGPLNKGKTNTQPMLYDWLDTFPMATGDHIDTVCEGKVIDTDAKDEESTHHLGANTYCSDNLYPKDFQETR